MTTPAADLKCPECGAPMVLRTTTKYTYDSGEPCRFYGCSEYPRCKGTHGAHPNGEPLGVPARTETKQWRIRAHEAFDAWAIDHGFTVPEAYRQLAQRFGVKRIHIGEMDDAQCARVVAFCEEDDEG